MVYNTIGLQVILEAVMSKKETQKKHIRKVLEKISEDSYEKEKNYIAQIDETFTDWAESVGKLMKPLNSALMVLRKEVKNVENIKIKLSKTNPEVQTSEKVVSISDYLMEGKEYEITTRSNYGNRSYQNDIETQHVKTPEEVMDIILREVGEELGRNKFWAEKLDNN